MPKNWKIGRQFGSRNWLLHLPDIILNPIACDSSLRRSLTDIFRQLHLYYFVRFVLDIFEHTRLDRNGKLISQHDYVVVP